MWSDVKEGKVSIFLTPKRSYVVVAGPAGQVVPGGECGEIDELCRGKRPSSRSAAEGCANTGGGLTLVGFGHSV
jgi:hypothetical protein